MMEQAKQKFRRKPVTVEAEQWFPGLTIEGAVIAHSGRTAEDGPWQMETQSGWQAVKPADWIVTGIRGCKYPVSNDVFADLYDPVFETVEPADGST
jgi:hypothetical protein